MPALPKQTILDLKEAESLSRSNLEKYAYIKAQVISTILNVPGINQEHVVQHLCNENGLTKEDFLMINQTERQAILDHMNFIMKKK